MFDWGLTILIINFEGVNFKGRRLFFLPHKSRAKLCVSAAKYSNLVFYGQLNLSNLHNLKDGSRSFRLPKIIKG